MSNKRGWISPPAFKRKNAFSSFRAYTCEAQNAWLLVCVLPVTVSPPLLLDCIKRLGEFKHTHTHIFSHMHIATFSPPPTHFHTWTYPLSLKHCSLSHLNTHIYTLTHTHSSSTESQVCQRSPTICKWWWHSSRWNSKQTPGAPIHLHTLGHSIASPFVFSPPLVRAFVPHAAQLRPLAGRGRERRGE